MTPVELSEFYSDDENVISQALDRLTTLDDPEIAQLVIHLAIEEKQNTRSDTLRQKAILTLGRLRATQAIIPLIGLFYDKQVVIRTCAVKALLGIGSPCIPALIEALAETHTREVALYTIIQLREASTLPVISALVHPDISIRKGAAYALGEIRDWRGIEPLVYTLGIRDMELRRITQEALLKIGESAIPALKRGLQSEDMGVKNGAMEVLERLGTPRAVEALDEWWAQQG